MDVVGDVVQLVRTLPCRWLESHTVTANSLPHFKDHRVYKGCFSTSPKCAYFIQVDYFRIARNPPESLPSAKITSYKPGVNHHFRGPLLVLTALRRKFHGWASASIDSMSVSTKGISRNPFTWMRQPSLATACAKTLPSFSLTETTGSRNLSNHPFSNASSSQVGSALVSSCFTSAKLCDMRPACYNRVNVV
jgi:hypothetical protein